ncbi:MAG: hypothetical protein RL483_315 [Pseudomonadota bacterium]|jgi:molybdopterin synthase sulfur carrier subunit
MPAIELRLFALLREQTGVDRQSLQTAAATLGDLRQELVGRGGPWQALADSGRIRGAVNQALAPESQALANGDEVAFFPPVTGG